MGITSHPASMHQLDASLLVLTVTLAEGGLLAFSPEKLLDPLSPHCPLQEDTSVLSLPLRTGEVGSLPRGRGPAYTLLYRTLPLLSQLFMDTTSYQGTLYFSAVRVSCDVHTWLPCDMSCLSGR